MNRNKSIAMMLTGIILVSLNMFVLTGVVASNVQAGVEELLPIGRTKSGSSRPARDRISPTT
jgi:hypothetical protein